MDVKIINKSEYPLPNYETLASAGMDVRANFPENDTVKLAPNVPTIIQTGIFMELPVGVECQVRPRSGLAAKQGITVLNAPGTIDADYRGEIGVILINLSKEVRHIRGGDRIAQFVFTKHEVIKWVFAEELSKTERGEGGFGSTGVSVQEDLLTQAKEKFPVGTKFYCLNTSVIGEITTGLFKVNDRGTINEIDDAGELTETKHVFNCVYAGGQWAKRL